MLFEYLQYPYHLSLVRHPNGNWSTVPTYEHSELTGQAKWYFWRNFLEPRTHETDSVACGRSVSECIHFTCSHQQTFNRLKRELSLGFIYLVELSLNKCPC